LRIVRVFVTGDEDLEEFGIVPLTIVNEGTSAVRLIGVHSGLLLGPVAEATGIATVLTLTEHRLDQPSYPRLAGLVRDAIATIIAGDAPAAAALDALCTLAASNAGQDGLRSVAAQELARASRQNGAPRDTAVGVDQVIEDVHAIVGSSLGTVDPKTVVFAPALPFEIVDEAGEVLPAQTEAARRRRAGSWRVQMPNGEAIERIRIRLDAALEIPGHSGVITCDNFYPAEDPNALYRWTGPGPTSTIALPLVLNKPSRLVIELGSPGRNGGREDFALTCNGKPVVHNFEIGGDGVVRLTADLAPSRLAGPSTEIGLTVKERFRPELPDRRTLGVVFRSLSLLIGGPELTAWGGRRHAGVDTELAADLGTFGRVTAEPPVGLRPGNAAGATAAAAPAGGRALVIDDSVPEPDKDAGSNAILQHMLSLQRLGYAVGFVPADNMARIDPYTAALEQHGIACFHRPDHASVADVLAEQPPYDLVYLHRHANLAQHGAAVRAHSPQARLVYSVADLHFLRLERQAELEGDAALHRQAGAVRAAELAAIAAADCVIVHSAAEAELLRQLMPGTEVRVVPWTVEPRRIASAAAKATTLAFIGGYRHPPNVDAATWAVRELMPRLRRELPGAELLLVGSHMPAEIAALTAADVLPVGHVDSLDEIYGQARLTIAPLRYGAGLKGKVLDSLAAGVPCVMSSVAAEGLDLPEGLQVLVTDDPEITARRIAMLCREDREYRRLAAAGQTYIAERYGAARIDALLGEACGTGTSIGGGPEAGVPAAPASTRRRGSRAGARPQPAAATELAAGDGE
jgi:glycosyltransferase involved in cell wall biosynthesis